MTLPTRSASRRLAPVARRLLLAACVCGLLLVTPALAAAAPEPATITVTASPATVVYGAATHISGAVSVAGAEVKLLRLRAGEVDWVTVRTVVAGADGSFGFSPTPPVNTEYKVVYGGDADHGAAEASLTVAVRPRLTPSFPYSLWLGDTVALRGSVAPAHPGGTVVIERLENDVWTKLSEVTLDEDSRFHVAWKPGAYGYHRLRLHMLADADHVQGYTPRVRVIVNRPNEHHVPYRFAHYIVIVRHEYKLYYYEHGKLVRSFRVALGRPGYPTPLGYFVMRAKVRPGGGALGSCVMYYYKSIAIHGTNEPYLLSRFPRNFSHGCARMYNSEALWLYYRCPCGTHIHNLR